VLIEIGGQGVQEGGGEAIAGTHGLATGVCALTGLEWLEVGERISHSLFLRG